MSELSEFVGKIPLLPEWAKLLSLNLVGVYIVLQVVHLILKKLEAPEIRKALASLKELSGEALRRAARSLELPVERPRAALVASAMNVVLMYVFSLLFFAWFGVFLMLSTTTENVVFYKRLIGFAVAGGFFVITRWYFASAERQRIALAASWKALRDRRDS